MTTTTFKRASVQALATRTNLYTAPSSITASVVFDGQITNLDSTTKASHFVTVEVYNGTTWHTIFKELEIPYGLVSPVPKIVMTANEILQITCSDGVANVIEAGVQIIERS